MVDRGQIEQQVNIHFEEADESVTISAPVRRGVMPSSFEPTEFTVLCGRGRDSYDHVGNRRLRVLVEERLDQYSATKSKFQKTLIVTSIIDSVREASNKGGAFVRKDAKTGRWVEIGDDATREKIGQMLREALIRKCPQKLEAKKRKRREKARRSSATSTGSAASAASAVAKSPPPSADPSPQANPLADHLASPLDDSVANSLANQMAAARQPMPSLGQGRGTLTYPASATNQFIDAMQQEDPQFVQTERLLVASRLLNWDLEPVSLHDQMGQNTIANRAAMQNSNFALNNNYAQAQAFAQQQRQRLHQQQQFHHQQQLQLQQQQLQQQQQLLQQQQFQQQQQLNQQQPQQDQQEDLPPMVWPWMENNHS